MKKPQLPFVTPVEFRALAQAGKAANIRAVSTGVQRDAEGKKPIAFIMSTSDQDRYGDIVDQDGWDTKSYQANPVLLWAHAYDLLPVGKVGRTAVEKSDGTSKLLARNIDFQPQELSQFGWAVGQMYGLGFLNAVSVGFRPLEYSFTDTGMLFKKQELLELSAVPVPANPNALLEAKGLGLWTPDHEQWVQRVLDEKTPGMVEMATQAYALLNGKAFQSAGVPDEGGGDEPLPEFIALKASLDANTAAVDRLAGLLESQAKAVAKSLVDQRIAQLVDQQLQKSA